MSRNASMAEHAAAAVINMIHENGYADGDKLPPERDLAVLLGVSRTTVREALKRLSALGYIRSVQGGGNYVSLADCNKDDPAENMRMMLACVNKMENALQPGGHIAEAIEVGDAGKAIEEIKEYIENIKKYLICTDAEQG